MKTLFFSKFSKYYVDFKNAIKFPETFDCFEGNCVWTSCGSFCQLWLEQMWSLVNLLKSGPKISDPTKRQDRELNLSDINGTLG